MISILTLLLVIALSMFVIKIASVALIQTGMERETARFQARSAFTGVGFTTADSERVVRHPVRRRIINLLIILGNAGIVTAISSMVLGFRGSDGDVEDTRKIVLLLLGATALILAAQSKWIDHHLNRLIRFLLSKSASLDEKAYTPIVNLHENYEITEVSVENNPWLRGHTISELDLQSEGVLILGIIRGPENYIGVPPLDCPIQSDDRLVCYGREKNLKEIASVRDRLKGKEGHEQRKREQQGEMKAQEKKIEQSSDADGSR